MEAQILSTVSQETIGILLLLIIALGGILKHLLPKIAGKDNVLQSNQELKAVIYTMARQIEDMHRWQSPGSDGKQPWRMDREYEIRLILRKLEELQKRK